jgi:hypothetical protein
MKWTLSPLKCINSTWKFRCFFLKSSVCLCFGSLAPDVLSLILWLKNLHWFVCTCMSTLRKLCRIFILWNELRFVLSHHEVYSIIFCLTRQSRIRHAVIRNRAWVRKIRCTTFTTYQRYSSKADHCTENAVCRTTGMIYTAVASALSTFDIPKLVYATIQVNAIMILQYVNLLQGASVYIP